MSSMAIKILDNDNVENNIIKNGLKTSKLHDYFNQGELWRDFFNF